MKTIADQYKLVTEGKLGQFQFMRNVRLTFPQFVTNVTSFSDAVKILKSKSIISEAKTEDNSHYCNPQEYDLGMRYELEKGTDEEKASKIVYKNLKDNANYYSQLHLAGYNEAAMKKDRKKRTDLPIEVKADILTEDEMVVLIGNILTESLNEGLLDNMKAKAKELADLYYDGDKSDERNYLYNYVKSALKKGNLSDKDKAELGVS